LPHVWVESKGVQQAIPGHREQTAQKMIERINQSFIKDFRAYIAEKECGNLIHAKYVDDRLLPLSNKPGDAEVGSYFEFMLSGALPKDGSIPMPILNTDKKPNSDYRKAVHAAKLVNEYLERMQLQVIKFGQRLTHGRFVGTVDLIVEYIGAQPMVFEETRPGYFERSTKPAIIWNPGDRFVIDLKYSGLLEGSGSHRNKHGWKFTREQREYHGTQAIQYHMISQLPFYFLVTQNNNKEGETPDVGFFHIPVNAQMIERHVNEANTLYDHFRIMAKAGFVPYPDFKKCNKCPLQKECNDKHTFPHPIVINLDDDGY
jgi:CRISPR/Cas system-associated exonuclease Cas4 (RecB family)